LKSSTKAASGKVKSVVALRILVANGVNLDLLGRREPEIYGSETLTDINEAISWCAPEFARMLAISGVELEFFQSNDEGSFLNKLDGSWDGILINPGAWSHTSLALGDRLAGLEIPYVEVHLSNLAKRESFRQHSYAAPHAKGVVFGFGLDSYRAGLWGLLAYLSKYNKALR
jgi:3-dehydroquinate dehydratase II